ncbi:tRNA lysidine(34) synthetase TilS [Roseivirga sp. BDSF3-8]|uniref:tRNA lysidine(34) synthetase TilS n=1 Tax=Roseivirga sp. BDSF3-8 TaxID=3241598 RepID=UPI003531D5B8
MLERFRDYIKNRALISPDSKVLLAVSGGVDSMVMADLFIKAGYNCAIAHCQFNLRGKESEEDEAFVRSYAQLQNIPAHLMSFDTKGAAEERGISIQMAARKLRYEWFTSLLDKHGFEAVATAHHLGDVAETMLINLTRGTGISGLHGIRSRQNRIIRPMLFASREDIAGYAISENIAWREDSSNQDTKYRRNEIRQSVLPVLKKQNPNLEQRMAVTSEKLAGAEAIVKVFVNSFYEQHCFTSTEGLIRIPLEALLATPAPALLLHELLKKYGYAYEQMRDVLGDGVGESGRFVAAKGYRLYRDREDLILQKEPDGTALTGELSEEEGTQHAAGYDWEISLHPAEYFEISTDSQVAALDRDKLIFPLKIRTWKQGDRFFPLGMKRQKKLSDFMIDEKIPLYLKEKVRVVCSGDDIVWVAGYRIDHRYRLTKDTKEVYRIGILEDYDKSI